MKVLGLITEYNPFHNGHKYHIEEAKKVTEADYVVVVMSGNFVQRGAPAIIDKYFRAQMALDNGADLVFELPTYYATASAEYFAQGAVSLLDKLSIVDYLCFGSESGDIKALKDTAMFLNNPPPSFDEQIAEYCKMGLSYPAAREKATTKHFQGSKSSDYKLILETLSEPNNILGIEYLKALDEFSSKIEAVTIKRVSSHYHDDSLGLSDSHSLADAGQISSATAIRNDILKNDDKNLKSKVKAYLPEGVYNILLDKNNKSFPITEEDFSSIIKYKLLSEDVENLTSYADMNEDLAKRIKNNTNLDVDIDTLLKKVKTKNMTYTRISRVLTHVLLNIKKEEFETFNKNGYTAYGRILGMRRSSSNLVRRIKEEGNIPIISNLPQAEKQLGEIAMNMLKGDIFAAHVYNQAIFEKFGTSMASEYLVKPCMIP